MFTWLQWLLLRIRYEKKSWTASGPETWSTPSWSAGTGPLSSVNTSGILDFLSSVDLFLVSVNSNVPQLFLSLVIDLLKISKSREVGNDLQKRSDLMSKAFFEPVQVYARLRLPHPLLDLTINDDIENDTSGKKSWLEFWAGIQSQLNWGWTKCVLIKISCFRSAQNSRVRGQDLVLPPNSSG